jgi:hypothetical protein
MGSFFRIIAGWIFVLGIIFWFIYLIQIGDTEIGMRLTVATITFFVGTFFGMFLVASNQ